MLKWTNSVQKPVARDNSSDTMEREQTPHIKKRLRKRNTICQLNKENIVPLTSTPFITHINNSHEVETPSSTIKIKTDRHSMTFSKFASTLPRFEEEYSPSTILPSGRELATRGLLPDVFTGNQRYFRSPLLEPTELNSARVNKKNSKQKLDFELKEESLQIFESSSELGYKNSNKITDQSLDKLIDAILESASKTQKRKKFRKSFNLRRRTLLKNHDDDFKACHLSPSYAAGEDPASDISELLGEPETNQWAPSVLPPTPLPHTPAYNHTLPNEFLLSLPTPVSNTPLAVKSSSIDTSTTTFNLETPIRNRRKRRNGDQQKDATNENQAKKFRRTKSDYLEVGLALPSIYV